MIENDKFEMNGGSSEQYSGADPAHQQQHAAPPRTSDHGCPSASGGGRLTTGRPGHASRPPRRPRAPYRHRSHRRTGKVARLPAVIRNEIALRFMRYEQYKDIIAWLASLGHPGINESNLSRWRKGGFRDWLRREQDKRLDLIDVALAVLGELFQSEENKPGQSGQARSSRTPSTPSPLPNLLGGPTSTLGSPPSTKN